jgi:DNA-binding XRE family transcriptional regulator
MICAKEGRSAVSPDPYSNPLAFFASEMKRMRAKLGITQEELADAAGFASSTVAAVETCRLLPSEEFAAHVDKPLQGDGHFVRMQELVEQTSARPWFHDLIKVERRARTIRTYAAYVIPGLLQTEDYARCCVLPTRPELTSDEVEQAVALRMSRQEILKREDPPELWVVLDESALNRVNGSADVMSAQREHLVRMSEQPNIVIQVIPDAEGSTVAGGREFIILSFASEPTVVYLEDIGNARYVRKHDEVALYALTFDHLRSTALRDDKSRLLIRGEK